MLRKYVIKRVRGDFSKAIRGGEVVWLYNLVLSSKAAATMF